MLEEPIAPLCSACEHPIRVGARFCPACGHSHTAEPPPSERAVEGVARVSLSAVISAQWTELTRIAWLYGLLLLSSLVFSWVMRFDESPWSGVAMAGIDAALIVGYAFVRRAEILELLCSPRLSMAVAARIAAITVVGVPVVVGYFALFELTGLPLIRMTDEYVLAGWPMWSMFVLISAMPAVFEELAFRGVIQCGLERVFSPNEAHLIQAALFSIVHLSPAILGSHFLMGLYLGFIRNQTRSLYPGMLAHAAWNAYWVADELFGSGSLLS
jgi:membrane protease YdiL (CAAX protease family)